MGVLFAWLFLGWAWFLWYLVQLDISFFVDHISEIIVVSIASFSGAYAAFYFNYRVKKKEIYDAKLKAFHDAQFALVQIMDATRNIESFILKYNKYSDPLWRATYLPASIHAEIQEVNFSISGLSFLFSNHTNAILNLGRARDQYFNMVRVLEERNRVHVEDYQVKVDQFGLNGKPQLVSELIEKITEKILGSLIQGTNDLYLAVIHNVNFQQQLSDELIQIQKEYFPDEKSIIFHYPDSESLENEVDMESLKINPGAYLQELRQKFN